MVANKNAESQVDAAALQSDLASFASTLGFSSASSSGFNNSDFRKTGPSSSRRPSNRRRDFPRKDSKFKNREAVPVGKSKPPQYPKNDSGEGSTLAESNRFKNLPKLPLVKPSALALWYNDAAELEEKLIGKDKKVEFNSVDDWKNLVEKKKELGERLLVQYAQEYLSSRGQQGDIKMLLATQRSGTAADKVSALSVLIGDNAVANLRSIDSLLGNLNFFFFYYKFGF